MSYINEYLHVKNLLLKIKRFFVNIFLFYKNIFWAFKNKEDREFIDKCIKNFKKDNFVYVYNSIESFDNIYGDLKEVKNKDIKDLEMKLTIYIFNIDLKRFESKHGKDANYKHYNMIHAERQRENQIYYFIGQMKNNGCNINRGTAIILLSDIYKNSKYVLN